jgi:hypothetical protein
VIAILNSPDLEYEFKRVQFEIDRIKLQLSRLASSRTARERREILASQLDEFTTEMQGLTETASSGRLTARHSGTFFKNLEINHEGQTVVAGTALGVLSNFDRLQYKMVVPSIWSDRIDSSKPIHFNDALLSLSWPLENLKDISTTPLNTISEPEFAQKYGGDIQTAVNDDNRPKGTWYRASSQAFKRPDNFPTAEITGTATLQSHPISYAQRTWASISQVLIQEWQF